VTPELVFIDGNRCPRLPMEARAVVRDSLVAISAASILAKVTRDAEMTELDSRHPEYGFARHKATRRRSTSPFWPNGPAARIPAELQAGAPRWGSNNRCRSV
jgi:hypothetical protein